MPGSKSRTVLRGGQLIDGTGAAPVPEGALVIEGSRIVTVGRYQDVAREPDDRVLDFRGKTILPGLVDAHTHLTLSGAGRTYEEEAGDSDEFMALRAVHNAQVHLRSGVTTLRDNGGRNRVTFIVREAQRRGFFQGPRLLLCGRPVTHSGGHFHWCNGVADGADEIRRAVRLLAAEGADHIKIMASGGATAGNHPGLPSYTVDELRVAVQTAHDLDRLTTAHCRATESIVNAVEAGLDCIEHAGFHKRGALRHFGHGVSSAGQISYDAAVAEQMARSGVFVSLTMQTGGYHTLKRLRLKARDEKLTPPEEARAAAIGAVMEQKVGVLHNLLGLDMLSRIVVSTDAGPFDVGFGRLYYGLELAVAAGMSPMQAIEAATRVAADACGMLGLVGTLQPGKEADIVVVDGDPLADIGAMADVAAVFIGGVAVAQPRALSDQLDVAERY